MVVNRVIGVGAGVGGPALGLWLRRIGVEVTLLEGRPSAELADGAFLGVAPNGMRVLDGLGLADRVRAVGHPCTAFRFLDQRGRTLGTFDRARDAARFGAHLTMVRRSDLHQLLIEAAREAGVDVRFGAAVRSASVAADEVEVALEGGGHHRGDLLVGCDGLRSVIRRTLLPDAPAPTSSGLLDCGGFVRLPAPPTAPGVNVFVFGARAFFGAFTTAAGETWWFHNGPVGIPEGRSLAGHLLALHRDDPPWVSALIAGTASILGPWGLFEVPRLPRWSAGRGVLLGDAAHAMSPSAGQGASLALEDAMCLARVLRDGRDLAGALTEYERVRRPRVEAIARAAARNSSGKAPSSAVGSWIRDRILTLVLPFGARAQERPFDHQVPW